MTHDIDNKSRSVFQIFHCLLLTSCNMQRTYHQKIGSIVIMNLPFFSRQRVRIIVGGRLFPRRPFRRDQVSGASAVAFGGAAAVAAADLRRLDPDTSSGRSQHHPVQPRSGYVPVVARSRFRRHSIVDAVRCCAYPCAAAAYVIGNIDAAISRHYHSSFVDDWQRQQWSYAPQSSVVHRHRCWTWSHSRRRLQRPRRLSACRRN